MRINEREYQSRDGLRLFYRDTGGDGTVVLCLPGLTRNSRDFLDLIEHIGPRYRVLAPDLRGRGYSDWDPKPARYHPGTYVADIWALVDGLDIHRLSVIGTSLGGLMAMIMASQQPERIRGVVLNDVGPELSPEGIGRILQYVGRHEPVADWQQAADQMRRNYGLALPDMPEGFWARHARRSFRENEAGRPVLDMDPAIGDALRRGARSGRLLRWLRRIGVLRRFGGVYIDPWDSFRMMSCPCLVLRGELSDVLSAKTVERMSAVKPDLVAVTIAGRGHTPLLDEPEALQAIDAFLNGLDADD